MSTAESPSQAAPWSAGWRSARANLVPGLILQAFALSLVLAYYYHGPTRAWCEKLAAFRTEQGLLYSFVATAFFGGLLPCLYLKLFPATRGRYNFKQNLLLIAFWAYKGIEVDLWYRVLVRLVGADANATTVVTKMFLDQFVYCPIFAVPVTVLVYAWGESRFDTAGVITDFRTPGWYRRRVLPMLISNLGVWVPAVCIIYALPTALQVPLFNLVLCFFTLLLAHLTRHQEPAHR
ncbi:MAG: hypothetical protein QM790_14520 [Nibricoccus sp.]